MERLCRECAAPLAGRSDKQFCCDACRTAWHNRRYRQEQMDLTSVNKVLRHNRKLLARVFKAGLSTIRLSDSRMRGYDIRFFTQVEHHLLRPAQYHCYEFSYVIVLGRICRIEKEPRPGPAI
ncbi:MAG: hypothetical protein J6X89_08760 [Bacteroidales bacterium]|nr:hypothetical protein [Bacteroidales bacterium]